MKTIIAPSVLGVDKARLQEEISSIEPYADWVQVDIMDGKFVPNTSFDVAEIKAIRTTLLIDVHLMVADPAPYIAAFLDAGAKHISFHAEAVVATEQRRALIKAIHEGGATAGIAINPETSVSLINDIVDEVDMVLVMGVSPGFGGQPFREEVLEKIKELRAEHPFLMIQVDGGINADTARLCREAGANNLVAGSFVFKAADKAQAIAQLRG